MTTTTKDKKPGLKPEDEHWVRTLYERYVQLYLYVHRVRGLDPGVYRYWPNEARLEPFKLGDQRVVAAALSLRQNLAGNACVAFSMIGDLERAKLIRVALETTVRDGKTVTRDLGGTATTSAMADAVIAVL